jgi:hypothetical protein
MKIAPDASAAANQIRRACPRTRSSGKSNVKREPMAGTFLVNE